MTDGNRYLSRGIPGALILTVFALLAEPAPARPGGYSRAILTPAGLQVEGREKGALVPGTEDVETFCWDRDGISCLVTTGETLARLDVAAGTRTVLWREPGMRVRSPSVYLRTGSIAVSIRRGTGPWLVAVMEPDGSRFRVNSEKISWRKPDTGTPELPPKPPFLSWEDFRDDTAAVHEKAGTGALIASLDPVLDKPVYQWAQRGLSRVEDPLSGTLVVAGVRWLTEAQARRLAVWRGRYLFLPDLERLDLGTARVLATTHAQNLHLDGLSGLDAATLRVLSAGGRRGLSFDGIKTLDEDLAAAVAEAAGPVSLDGVREVKPAVLRRLAAWRGNGEQYILSLNGLASLTEEPARALAGCRGWGLSLDGLTTLSLACAKELASFHGARLTLDGLTAISPELAEVMAGWNAKWVELKGVRRIPDKVRSILDRGRPVFMTPGAERSSRGGRGVRRAQPGVEPRAYPYSILLPCPSRGIQEFTGKTSDRSGRPSLGPVELRSPPLTPGGSRSSRIIQFPLRFRSRGTALFKAK